MKLFVGLGNPGAEYARNRHNIGFMAVDRIADDHGFSPWKSKFQGRIAEGRLGSEKVLLLKPETYMNRSGQSVGDAMRFYKLGPEDITVFHDELDLAPGKCRAKTGGGHAGHNGLRSLHAHVGDTYHRIRIGIGHPGRKELVSGYVLHDFAKADEAWLDDLIRGIADGAPALAAGDAGKFMNAVSLRVAPPRSGGGEKAGAKSGTTSGARPKAGPGKAPGADPSRPPRSGQPAQAPEPAKPAPDARPGPEDDHADGRSALQKLVDRFK